jgi:hypothetical protein
MMNAGINTESRITLTEAADILPRKSGKKMQVKTLYRWILKGCRGARLTAVKCGGQWYTTRGWLTEFEEACTRRSTPDGDRTVGQRSVAARRAQETLKRRFGFGQAKKRREGRTERATLVQGQVSHV